ncbi:MAG: pilus assembly protein [Deltaproteobacteria bacterium]|nr:pilus assembly protein [Deltaproteobacteria bacterium]MBW2255325.1 pilus assembly protein [Deltaproteobacteria bacterium]
MSVRPVTKNRKGGAGLEFALVLPVLLLLILPIIDFTWFFLNMQHVQEAAWSGARAGARIKLDDDPVAVAEAMAKASLEASMPAYAASATCTATIDGDILRLKVRVPYDSLAGFVKMPTDLYVNYRMRLEDP